MILHVEGLRIVVRLMAYCIGPVEVSAGIVIIMSSFAGSVGAVRFCTAHRVF